MTLETVVEDIREEARARAEEIREEGEAEAESLVEAAEADAEETLEAAERRAERNVEQERERELSSAKLEAKQMRLEARRDVLEAVRDSVEEAIVDLDGEDREELTRALLDDAATEFEDADSVLVHGRADDEELVEEILADYDGYEWAGEYDCLGGVVVESEEGRLRVNNTFDSVVEDVWEDELKEISTRLFDEQ
ncbi:V-type ATP synthase subunit E [Haloarchaeobius sp. FL176]|uniref:V-type ATP synthase subunit E n=1 Tax=Haloarchaeobius sp. FL176 TaxID=2967129 RepID=UPI0021481EC5|nr:V-type ATP synthase subunit E [Haloarchaeobius sp. FL176]